MSDKTRNQSSYSTALDSDVHSLFTFVHLCTTWTRMFLWRTTAAQLPRRNSFAPWCPTAQAASLLFVHSAPVRPRTRVRSFSYNGNGYLVGERKCRTGCAPYCYQTLGPCPQPPETLGTSFFKFPTTRPQAAAHPFGRQGRASLFFVENFSARAGAGPTPRSNPPNSFL
jgi:hypothetical protein